MYKNPLIFKKFDRLTSLKKKFRQNTPINKNISAVRAFIEKSACVKNNTLIR